LLRPVSRNAEEAEVAEVAVVAEVAAVAALAAAAAVVRGWAEAACHGLRLRWAARRR
jgi:hypothetical protein